MNASISFSFNPLCDGVGGRASSRNSRMAASGSMKTKKAPVAGRKRWSWDSEDEEEEDVYDATRLYTAYGYVTVIF